MARPMNCAFAVVIMALTCLGAAAAQIMELRADGTACMHSGLSSDLKNCDVPNWYAYAFVGSISAITPIENGESELKVTPEEVFHGDPGTSLTVRTSQGSCLPKLLVGDRCFFSCGTLSPLSSITTETIAVLLPMWRKRLRPCGVCRRSVILAFCGAVFSGARSSAFRARPCRRRMS